MCVVEIDMVTTEASGSNRSFKAWHRAMSEKQETSTACKKAFLGVSWNGFGPAE